MFGYSYQSSKDKDLSQFQSVHQQNQAEMSGKKIGL
jgi:hypothetical protein